MANPVDANPHCSFCGMSQRAVKKLISGPRGYICDACVGICNDILRYEAEHGSCSFCGKHEQKVKKLIPGPRVAICDECIALCNVIFAESQPDKADDPEARESLSAFAHRWFVIKLGGELISPERLSGVAEAVKTFTEAKIRTVIVHGGGPQATELTRRLGLTPQKIGGRRVTDAEVLRVVKQALAGEVSVDLAAFFRAQGVRVLALHGVSGGLISAEKRPPRIITGGPPEPVDLGFVGDVTAINTSLLEGIVSLGYVPVVASLGGDSEGGVFNINADIVAAQTAQALNAAKLFLVSGVPGVLEDIERPESRIPALTPETAKEAIERGVIQGGMIPKVEEALSALLSGVESVHICGAGPGDILQEALSPGSRGTVFTKG